MSLIYRNVVPNVPAWTAGNGAMCYDPDTGRPVYRAESTMWFEPDWSPDICSDAAWLALVDSSTFIRWAGSAPTVAEITAWAQTDPDTGAKPTFYYNAPTSSASGWQRYASTGGEYDVAAATSYGYSFHIGDTRFVHELLWDAANAYWQWRVRMTALAASRVYYYDDDGTTTEGVASMAVAAGMRFASAQLTNDLRPGAAGIALTPSSTTNIMHANSATLYTSH